MVRARNKAKIVNWESDQSRTLKKQHSKLIFFAPLYVPKCSSLLSSVFLRNEFKGPQMSKLKGDAKAEYMSEYYRMENDHVCFLVM